MLSIFWIIAVLCGLLALAYVNASGRAWGLGIAGALLASWVLHALPLALNLFLTVVFIAVAIPLAIPTLRRKLISDDLRVLYRRLMPPMSQTSAKRSKRHRVVGWRIVLGTSRLAPVDRDAAALAHAGGTAFSSMRKPTLCEMTSDWRRPASTRTCRPRGSTSRTRASSG
jgi:acyl-CoA dehydrogenase